VNFYLLSCLSNEKIRKAMIEKAYQRCVPAYSYDQRAKEIASLIE
jgi:spore maturation protein CgeB